MPRSRASQLAQRDDAAAHRRHRGRAAGRELVDARLPVDDHAVLAAELREGVCHRLDPLLARSTPDQLAARAGRVGERAEQVEHRAHAELARTAPACRIAGWYGGANRKPNP